MGYLNSGYIDDSYLQGNTVNNCCANVQDTAKLMSDVGFLLHPDKSVFTPTQNLTFLGFLVDSVRVIAAPLQKRLGKLSSGIKICFQP